MRYFFRNVILTLDICYMDIARFDNFFEFSMTYDIIDIDDNYVDGKKLYKVNDQNLLKDNPINKTMIR